MSTPDPSLSTNMQAVRMHYGLLMTSLRELSPLERHLAMRRLVRDMDAHFGGRAYHREFEAGPASTPLKDGPRTLIGHWWLTLKAEAP